MKKKLSFLLALVFIFTLAFSVIPGAGATYAHTRTLTVSKAVSGQNASLSEEFAVKVEFTLGTQSTGSLSDITNNGGITPVPADGVYTLSLNHNETVVFSNIPVGTSYKVTENDLTSAQTEAGWSKGTIVYDDKDTVPAIDDLDDDDSVTVNNIYTEPPFGTLTITKDVITDKAPSDGVLFEISAKFTLPEGADPALYLGIMKNGSSVDATVNGAYLFQLGDGDSVTFSKIPVGTTYVVTEPLTGTPAAAAGFALDSIDYSSDKTGDRTWSKQKIDYPGDTDTATVENEYTYGMLEVKKDVLTANAPAAQFPITVTFSGTDDFSSIVPPTGATSSVAGTYSFTLGKDGTAIFYGIKDDVKYVVSETLTADQTAAGWNRDGYKDDDTANGGSKSDGKGKIDCGETDKVTVKNEYNKGILTVTKDVTTTNAPAGVPFPITVTFTYRGDLSGIIAPAGATLNAGVYTINLMDGASATFYGIPVGAIYSVAENLTANHTQAGWSLASICYDDNDYWKSIDDCGDSDSVIVNNRYCAPDTGYIIINKEITGTKSEVASFIVNVKFANTNPYMDLSKIEVPTGATPLVGGGYAVTFTTPSNMSVKFDKIPVGTTYEVTEPASTIPEFWSFVSIDNTDKTEPLNTIEIKGDDDVITITNHFTMPTGTLIVDKTVTAGSPVNVPFTFTVVFSGYDLGQIDASYQQQEESINTAPQQIQINPPEPETRSFTFTQTAAQSAQDPVTFTNIPLGTNYIITESKDLPANWAYVSGDGEGSFNRENLEDTVTFLNNYTPPVVIEYGSLIVDKTVSGTNASGTEPFAITVTFTANPWNISGISNSLGLPVSPSGVYTFNLSADSPVVTFSNIPAGTTYTVSEAIATTQIGWTEGASTGKTGTITTAGASAVLANVYAVGVAGASDNTGNAAGSEQGVAGASDVLPQTGGIASSTLLGLLGLALIAIGGTAFTLLRKKNTGKSR